MDIHSYSIHLFSHLSLLNITPNFRLKVHFVSPLVSYFSILHSLDVTLHPFSSAVVSSLHFTVELSSGCPLFFFPCDRFSAICWHANFYFASTVIFTFLGRQFFLCCQGNFFLVARFLFGCHGNFCLIGTVIFTLQTIFLLFHHIRSM